jgi:hypothetical protein
MRRFLALALFLLTPVAAGRAVNPHHPPESAALTSSYELFIKVLPDAKRLEVAGTWRMPPASAERSQIEFFLSPKMGGLTVRLLEPKLSAPLNLEGSREDGGDTKWVFKPARPIPAGQSVLLQFSYVSDGKPAPQLSVGPAGAFAGGGGELWYPQAAYKNRETGTLRFTVPAGEKVISNGTPQSTPEQAARGEYVFRVEEPAKFGFASGRYTVARRAGRVPFNLYLLRPRASARTILDGCARALEHLAKLYGDLPYGELSLVEVDFPTIVTGTSEFGFILADDSKLDEFDLAYWAHEMGHQWWGNLVRSASGTTGQMMLSEGVAQFGALQAVEAVEGRAAAEQFRRNGYHGKGHSAAAYFRLTQSGADFPLTAHVPKNQNETLTMHRLANTKGFILLDMLSRSVGRVKFAAILRRFVRQKANQTTSWQEFQRAVEAGAEQDARWFFEQWFERTGAPDYQLTWNQRGGRIQGTITQPAPHFRATLEIEVRTSRRTFTRTVEVAGERTTFDWAAPHKVESVTIDPHYKVLRWLPDFRPRISAGAGNDRLTEKQR